MSSSRQKITAAIYDRRGRQLSLGKNSYKKTHPLQAKLAIAVGENDKVFLHAEIDAIVRLKDWSKAHRIVITRYDKNGKPVPAKPCKVCQRAIFMLKIQHIEHT